MGTDKRLARSSSDKWIAGVCSGVANYFGGILQYLDWYICC